MKIIVADNYLHMSEIAADMIAEIVRKKPDCVLGLATGSSPVVTYKRLIDKYHDGDLSFEKVKTVNLDEYVGLTEDNEQSYHYFMKANLLGYLNVKEENIHIPCGVGDAIKNCEDYRSVLQANPRDIQILGIGRNGHIGFNEPGTSFESRTHIVDLAEKTINDNARFFDDISQVPRQAITMGIGDILQSKKILLLASGTKKADAIYKTVCGKVTEDCPASVLQLHCDVTLIIDKDAASKLDESVLVKFR